MEGPLLPAHAAHAQRAKLVLPARPCPHCKGRQGVGGSAATARRRRVCARQWPPTPGRCSGRPGPTQPRAATLSCRAAARHCWGGTRGGPPHPTLLPAPAMARRLRAYRSASAGAPGGTYVNSSRPPHGAQKAGRRAREPRTAQRAPRTRRWRCGRSLSESLCGPVYCRGDTGDTAVKSGASSE